jgi:serine/threonine protein kinase
VGDAPTRLGRYELVRLLARGGMADVFLARSLDDAREVAVKVLAPTRIDDDESVALFRDEARVAGLLDHTHIASVYELASDDGVCFLAMEYVPGKDLREMLAACALRGREVPFGVAVSIVAAAAAGLDHAHRRCDRDGRPLYLVHRDVSLSNIMVRFDGGVKVVDFGIASAVGASHQTRPGIVRGKASYMSPEQCMGTRVDLRTDVFALGVVLYELTTGRRCILGDNDFERMVAAVRGEYIPPRQHDAMFPRELELVIMRALANDPERRYPSAAAMIEALERVAQRYRWVQGATAIEAFLGELFAGVERPAPAHPRTRVARRSLAGLDNDTASDDLPTRGRRSLPRIPVGSTPLAA